MPSLSNESDIARRGVRSLWVIWSAFVAAALFYAVLAFFLHGSLSTTAHPPKDPGFLRYFFYAAGGVAFAGSFFLRRHFDGRSFPDAPAAMRGTMTAMVAGLALMESVSLFGLVLVVLGGSTADAVPLLAAGVGGVLLQRPNPAGLDERIRSESGR
jgi:hypothetical protein